jgi:predicted small lipoprotein YifL
MSDDFTLAPGRTLERRRLLTLLGVSVAAWVGACGKKGPLRRPEPPSTADTSDEDVE